MKKILVVCGLFNFSVILTVPSLELLSARVIARQLQTDDGIQDFMHNKAPRCVPVQVTRFSDFCAMIAPAAQKTIAKAFHTFYPAQALTGHTGWIGSVAISPDENFIASGSADGSIKPWSQELDGTFGKKVVTLYERSKEIVSLAISADGSFMVSGTSDRGLALWKKNEHGVFHQLQQRFTVTLPTIITALALNESSDRIACALENGTIRILTKNQDGLFAVHHQILETYQEVPADSRPSITALAFNPSGDCVISGAEDSVISTWTRDTAELWYEENQLLVGHRGHVKSLATSSCGPFMVSGSRDKTVGIWKKETTAGIYQFFQRLTGHTKCVRSVAISSDAEFVASASNDTTVRVWRSKNDGSFGERPQILKGHTLPVTSVEISKSGDFIVSGSDDKRVRIWKRAEDLEQALVLKALERGIMINPEKHSYVYAIFNTFSEESKKQLGEQYQITSHP